MFFQLNQVACQTFSDICQKRFCYLKKYYWLYYFIAETMASTVEQCESKSIGPLSSTLEMFDTFKNAQDDDKDSDEESFHLPLLGCDDDMENGETSKV